MPEPIPTDTQLLKDRVAGLKANIKELRQGEAELLRAAGLDEQAEKADQEAQGLAEEIKKAKAFLATLKARRTEAVGKTAQAMAAKMAGILPEGEAVFTADDSGMFLGWKKADGRTRPHAGLSGGERVIFDAALAYALLGLAAHRVLILEAAELDTENLARTLAAIEEANPDTQIIVLTCHGMDHPDLKESGWTIIDTTPTTPEAAQ
jgi:DNA repair exonuclease SbcCD ATPase subunit